jgi:hypothetical protein
MLSHIVKYYFNVFPGYFRTILGKAIGERQFAEAVDFARDPAGHAENHFKGETRKNAGIFNPADPKAVVYIFYSVVIIKIVEMKPQENPLVHLLEPFYLFT